MAPRTRSDLLYWLSTLFAGGGVGVTLVLLVGQAWAIGYCLLWASFACSFLDWRRRHASIKAQVDDRLDALRFRGVYPREGEGTDDDVRRLNASGEKALAIRLFYELHGGSLSDAKRGVDALK